jgi:hypothetical protein
VVRLPPRGSDHARNRGWLSDCHPRRLDCLVLCGSFIAFLADFGHAPRGAHDFSHAPRGAHDSTHATRGLDIYDSGCATHGTSVPALPAALVASPLGYVGSTDTASTSKVTTVEGRTGGTSSQPSSNDHAGEARLPATDLHFV